MNHKSKTSILLLTLAVLIVAGGPGSLPAAAQQVSGAPTPTPATVVSQGDKRSIGADAVTARPVQPLAALQANIRGLLSRPEAARGRVGVKIVSLSTGKVIFEQDAEKYFMPASNMKNFTIAAALERLGPDFRFVTSVYAPSLPNQDGVIKGDLRVYGRGDISISTAFAESLSADPERHLKVLDGLVEKIAAAGVKRVEGDLVGDESYFTGNAIPVTWEWDDLQTYYGTEISALPLNDNAIDISIAPGPVGYACEVKLIPRNPVFRVTNRCITSPAGGRRDLEVVKRLDQNIIEITGSMPAGGDASVRSIAVTHPAELFIALLRQRLELKGITITGKSRTTREPRSANCADCPASPETEIAKLESPPLSVIAARTMKPSQNMYTETILWTLGEHYRLATAPAAGPRPESARLGLDAVKEFLKSIGVPEDGIVQYDGSGLSRHDLITPSAVVTLYAYMARQSKHAQAWRDSLTIGGVDGTLRNRFKGTAAAGNIRGKTGTIDQVSALSGYLTTAGGEQLALSIVVNGVPTPRDRVSLIDDIVLAAANFDGKVEEAK